MLGASFSPGSHPNSHTDPHGAMQRGQGTHGRSPGGAWQSQGGLLAGSYLARDAPGTPSRCWGQAAAFPPPPPSSYAPHPLWGSQRVMGTELGLGFAPGPPPPPHTHNCIFTPCLENSAAPLIPGQSREQAAAKTKQRHGSTFRERMSTQGKDLHTSEGLPLKPDPVAFVELSKKKKKSQDTPKSQFCPNSSFPKLFQCSWH